MGDCLLWLSCVGVAAWCARGRRSARSPAAAWPARPLAVRAASFARRVGSKPGQAPQASRRPSCLWCLWRRWCSRRRRPRPPARLGVLTSFGAAPRSPPVPSGPSGALHTGGAWGSGVSVQAPRRPSGGPTRALPSSFACNSPWTYCLSVSLHVAESLLFGNCMRLWGGWSQVGVEVGCNWGVQMGRKSYVSAGGKKFEWKWVTGQRVFVAMLDGFGVTGCRK